MDINEYLKPQNPPKSYLVESILVTVFCCLPFGIIGIVNASNVESLYKSGDYEGAERASQKAKKWMIMGLVGGIVVLMLYVFLNILSLS
jgi:hypothetical protein